MTFLKSLKGDAKMTDSAIARSLNLKRPTVANMARIARIMCPEVFEEWVDSPVSFGWALEVIADPEHPTHVAAWAKKVKELRKKDEGGKKGKKGKKKKKKKWTRADFLQTRNHIVKYRGDGGGDDSYTRGAHDALTWFLEGGDMPKELRATNLRQRRIKGS